MGGGPFGAANTWTPVYGTFVCSVHHYTQLFPPDEEEHRDDSNVMRLMVTLPPHRLAV
jgi:hypothetical protein